MSILFGILNKNGARLERGMLDVMAAPTQLPGCVPVNTWSDDCFGFGISQRYETPQDQLVRQPLIDNCASVHFIATGRLDYREDLARKLGFPVAKLDKVADVALMQLAWHKWQQDCVLHLEGDWSLAVWDAKSQRLHLMRDAAGISALHYFDSPYLFAFSTRVDSLLQLSCISREPNMERLIEILAICASDGSTTGYRDVRRMPPASRLHVGRSATVQVETYRDPLEATTQVPAGNDCFDQFVEIFENAVEARMRSVGPVGLTLSSGFDSSSVAVAANRMARTTGQRMTAYSAVPLDPTFEIKGRVADESPLIRQSCEHLSQVDFYFTNASDVTPVHGMIEALNACCEPSHAVANHYWIVSLLRQAHLAGITSLLTGQAGNATISWQGADRRAWHDVLAGDFKSARSRWYRQRQRGSLSKTLKSELVSPVLSRWRLAYLPRYLAQRWIENSFLSSSADSLILVKNRLIAQRRNALADSRYFLLETICRQANAFWAAIGDWTGVSVRDPTCDERLIKFCLSLDDGQFQNVNEQRLLAGRYLRSAGLHHVVDARLKGLQAADISQRLPLAHAVTDGILARIMDDDRALALLNVDQLRLEWLGLQRNQAALFGGGKSAEVLRALSVGYFLCS